jgi:hypothetical protein
MGRKILLVLFTLGVIGGYGAAIAHLGGHRCWHCDHAAWRERVADVCVRAAERTWAERGALRPGATPAPDRPPGPPPGSPSGSPPGAL